MLTQSDAVKQAWQASERTLDIVINVDGVDYPANNINSLSYDAGAFTGDSLGIGSNYENSISAEFSSVIETFKAGLTVKPKIGIKVNGKFEYTPLGVFIISEVNRDRNNNLTTIKALDQMVKLEEPYTSALTYPAKILDVVAEIANQGGVKVNQTDLTHLPSLPNLNSAITGQTLRAAIGWIAQFYAGFAAFDREGQLTIRTTATPDYTIDPGEYMQGGLTKNEVTYKTGGIKVSVTTTSTTETGEKEDKTEELHAGETTGSQIELTNNVMTSDALTTIWTSIKDVSFYPYSLNWFGNPALEAGDWVTLTDTQGNKFNVPVNQLTFTFNGGLESTISATQSSSTAGGYAYTGSAGTIKNMIEELQVRHTATGNIVYPPSYQGQPQNPKKGDVWYKQNGNNVEVWIYQEEDGKLSWIRTPLDGEVKAELQAMGKKTDEDLTRAKSELSSEAESQWVSAKTATSETDQRLTSLQAENSQSLADLHDTANSLHAAANSLHADADSMRGSLTAATSEVGNNLTSVKNSLAAVDNDLRNGITKTGNDLSVAKTSLAATGNSLATATSELQRKTGQLSGSLSTADSMIMFNSNAIAEVKRMAGEISTTVSNIRVGGRNLLTNTRTLTDVWNGATETVDGFTAAKMTKTAGKWQDIVAWNLTNIKPNTDYVLTFYAKASQQTQINSYFYNIGTGDTYIDGSTPNTLTTDYQHYTVHFHTMAMPTGRTVNCLPVRVYDNVTVWVYGCQLEEGNTATQWQPNPADTNQAISKVSQTADTIRADLINANHDIASVKAKADSLTSRMTNAEGSVSSLQQTAKSLQSTVTDHSGKISQLQQEASGLSATVLGGGNLLNNTSDTLQSFTGTDWAWYVMSDDEPVAKHKLDGQKVTLSAWIENPSKEAWVQMYTNTGMAQGNKIPAGGSGWSQVTYTMPSGFTYWNVVVGCGDGSGTITLSYSCLQLELGPNRTAWSQSTADIAQLKITADGLTTKVADTESNVSSLQLTAKGLQTQVTNNKNDVASLQVTAGGIRTDLTNAKNDIASVRAKADSLTTSMANANDQISTLQHRADSITSTLSNGGVNLLNKSNEFGWGIAGWNGNPSHSIIDDDNGLKDYKISLVAGAGYDGFWWGGNNTLNQTYTLSFDAKSDNGAAKLSMAGLEGNFLMSNPPTISKEWMRYSVSGKVTEANHNWIIYFAASTADNVYVRRVQLEYGDNATPWKPSNGDISSLQQTAQGLTADMKDAKGNISNLQFSAGQLTTDMKNANRNISSIQETADRLSGVVGDANSGLVSSVNAIPGKISSAITASKQATVIASAVDLHNMTTAGYYLLKGTLTNSPVDAWAFLRVITSDSGDRIYHRIWKDNASTVYTEEWTGSWSDWATHINSDNLKSNVITAINQSTEGVSITGAKITLDGNVNVAPGFTLSADRITAGTLSADRISGGTLNFSNITVNGLTANSISSGSISGQNLNINLDNGTVEFTKGNLHSTDGGFNISIDNKSVYLDIGNGSKLWIDSNGFHLQESATQHLWMNKDGLHNFTDANGNGVWLNDTELKVLNSANAGLVAKDGMLQFSANPIWNSDNVYSGTLNDQLYGTIGFNSNLLSSSLNGIFIKGREGVVIGTSSYGGGSLFGADGFLDVGQAGSGINLPDDLNKPASLFTKSALTLLGGPTYPAFWGMSDKARVCIGCDTYYTHNGASMYSRGNDTRGNNISINARNTNIIGYDWVNIHCRNGRIALDAQWVHSYPTYNHTTSAGANVYVAEDGALIRSSSARKYKTDIQDADNDYGNKLIEFAPQKWIDKAEKKRYEEDPENNKKPGYYYGLIADDLDAAGLDMLVNYGAEGEVEGINYDRLAVALLPVIKSLKDQVASLKKQVKELTK